VDSALIGSCLCGSGNLSSKEASCLNAGVQEVLFIALLVLSRYATLYVLF